MESVLSADVERDALLKEEAMLNQRMSIALAEAQEGEWCLRAEATSDCSAWDGAEPALGSS